MSIETRLRRLESAMTPPEAVPVAMTEGERIRHIMRIIEEGWLVKDEAGVWQALGDDGKPVALTTREGTRRACLAALLNHAEKRRKDAKDRDKTEQA